MPSGVVNMPSPAPSADLDATLKDSHPFGALAPSQSSGPADSVQRDAARLHSEAPSNSGAAAAALQHGNGAYALALAHSNAVREAGSLPDRPRSPLATQPVQKEPAAVSPLRLDDGGDAVDGTKDWWEDSADLEQNEDSVMYNSSDHDEEPNAAASKQDATQNEPGEQTQGVSSEPAFVFSFDIVRVPLACRMTEI